MHSSLSLSLSRSHYLGEDGSLLLFVNLRHKRDQPFSLAGLCSVDSEYRNNGGKNQPV